MGIFSFLSTNNLQSPVQTVEHYDDKKTVEKSFGFSTPFGNIGSGNLTLPFVDKHFSGNGYVRFGSDNLYPQLLNQLYYMSGIHKTALDYKIRAISGDGYSIGADQVLSVNDKIDIKKFETLSKLKIDIVKIVSDYVIHSRICLKIFTNKDNKIIKLERICPSKVRTNQDRSKFIVSDDWSKGLINQKTYNNYELDSKSDVTLFEYCKFSPGQDIYPIPSYNSINNFVALDNDISYFLKNNLQNSSFFSFIINKKNQFVDSKEAERFKKTLDMGKGAGNVGKILVVASSGGDDQLEIKELKNTDNSKIFDTTIDIKNNEIAIGHSMDPQILGIQVAGKLGNSSEQPFAYKKWEKLFVLPERAEIENAINYIFMMAQINFNFKFNEYSIIDQEMVDLLNGTTNADKTTESVDMSSDEKTFINENLKGLSAQDSINIIRIIRDFNKGKLPYVLAETRLLSYSIDIKTIKKILNK